MIYLYYLDKNTIVESTRRDFEIYKWYRVEVDYNFENIRVKIQTDQIREKKVVFETKMYGLHRGSIGFATNGNIFTIIIIFLFIM